MEIQGDLVRHVETRDVLRRIEQLIERLPSTERALFVLYHVEHRTLSEIAEMRGYSLATTKRKVGRASRRFELLLSKNRELLQRLRE